jgi:hypothetical protein
MGYGPLDISPCLLGIRHLPHLRKLYFCYKFITMPQNDAALQRLLGLHSNGLRELFIDFSFPPLWVHSQTWGFFHVILPNLESLTLGSGCLLDHDRAVAYARQFLISLTELKFGNLDFSYHKLEMMVNAISGQGRLRTLGVAVEYLSPGIICLLATRFPSIDSLFLRIGYLYVSASQSTGYAMFTPLKNDWEVRIRTILSTVIFIYLVKVFSSDAGAVIS